MSGELLLELVHVQRSGVRRGWSSGAQDGFLPVALQAPGCWGPAPRGATLEQLSQESHMRCITTPV